MTAWKVYIKGIGKLTGKLANDLKCKKMTGGAKIPRNLHALEDVH